MGGGGMSAASDTANGGVVKDAVQVTQTGFKRSVVPCFCLHLPSGLRPSPMWEAFRVLLGLNSFLLSLCLCLFKPVPFCQVGLVRQKPL